jgi:hypothetical protein
MRRNPAFSATRCDAALSGCVISWSGLAVLQSQTIPSAWVAIPRPRTPAAIQ